MLKPRIVRRTSTDATLKGAANLEYRGKPSLLESGMCRILQCMFMFSLIKYKRKSLLSQTDRGTQQDASAKYLSESFGFYVGMSAKQPSTTTSKNPTTTSKTACTKTENDETKPEQRSRLTFFNRFIYLLTILLVSVVSFRHFGF